MVLNAVVDCGRGKVGTLTEILILRRVNQESPYFACPAKSHHLGQMSSDITLFICEFVWVFSPVNKKEYVRAEFKCDITSVKCNITLVK